MGHRGCLITLGLALTACGATQHPAPAALGDRVVHDFEAAVLASRDAYVALFDFAAVGEYEILLHRYDLQRLPDLSDGERAQFEHEDGTPYPAARERRNVGNFYPILAQRTVGSGGCRPAAPRSAYGKLLGQPFAPIDAPPGYAKLRADANAWLATGGVIGLTCAGGTGGLALVYTRRDTPRGYDLITIYED